MGGVVKVAEATLTRKGFAEVGDQRIAYLCKESILQAKSTTREPGIAGLHE